MNHEVEAKIENEINTLSSDLQIVGARHQQILDFTQIEFRRYVKSSL